MIKLAHDEKVLYIVRKHWFFTFLRAVSTFFFAVAPLLVFIIGASFIGLELNAEISRLLWILYLVWLIICWVGLFLFWTDYVLDIWIITNKRIIDIEQKGLFSRESSSMRLENIQDITSEVSGIIGTYFGYGTITMQTSATEREFLMPFAAEANKAKAIIMNLHDQVVEEKETVQLSPENIEQLRRALDGDPNT
jgi:hypothetical protein